MNILSLIGGPFDGKSLRIFDFVKQIVLTNNSSDKDNICYDHCVYCRCDNSKMIYNEDLSWSANTPTIEWRA
jgi:hypothetical protein